MSRSRLPLAPEEQEQELHDPPKPPSLVLDDVALVTAAQSDPAAFASLYAHYLQPVYRYCYRRLGTVAAAEDATSDIFVKVLVALPRYRAGSFRSWLFAIAHHVTADALRRQRTHEHLDAVNEPVDTRPTPEDLALAAEGQRALLAHLAEDQRSVVELRLAGLTDVEVAETLGRSVSAVKTVQFRAIARLRRLLSGEGVARDGEPQ